MISELPIFQIYEAIARHAAERQKVSAGNISRAGEPGFQAVEIESFEAYLARTKMTDPNAGLEGSFRTYASDAPRAPNGNSVSLEREVFNSASAMGQHSLALSVYTKTLDLMRTAIGKRG